MMFFKGYKDNGLLHFKALLTNWENEREEASKDGSYQQI